MAAGFLFSVLDTNVGIHRLEVFSPDTCPRRAANLVTIFLFLSATINPLIYAFTNCGFKSEFRKLLRCCHASNKCAAADVYEIREIEDEANV